jgi:gentisate 1,2-dioxygenase
VVDGQAVPLHPGDLVLTPAGCWHGHVHPGDDEPVVWFDGLDVSFVMSVRAGFFESAPAELEVAEAVPSSGTELDGVGLWPAEQVGRRHSPLRRYPWEEAYPALRRLMARDGTGHGVRLEYRNPLSGGPALATISCSLVGLAAGERTRTARETASSVYFVARGAGWLDCDGRRRDFATNDVIAVPSWTRHQLAASDDELVLFRISDRPIQDAFGLYRAETS